MRGDSICLIRSHQSKTVAGSPKMEMAVTSHIYRTHAESGMDLGNKYPFASILPEGCVAATFDGQSKKYSAQMF
jgi:hypothetical protein